MAKGLEYISLKDIQMANKNMERAHDHYSCKSKQQGDYRFTPFRWLLLKINKEKQKIIDAAWDVDKLEPLYKADGTIKWCNHYGKQCDGSSKNWK